MTSTKNERERQRPSTLGPPTLILGLQFLSDTLARSHKRACSVLHPQRETPNVARSEGGGGGERHEQKLFHFSFFLSLCHVTKRERQMENPPEARTHAHTYTRTHTHAHTHTLGNKVRAICARLSASSAIMRSYFTQYFSLSLSLRSCNWHRQERTEKPFFLFSFSRIFERPYISDSCTSLQGCLYAKWVFS